jgi:pimeloyl-ACP methyl ester carboxylesterase
VRGDRPHRRTRGDVVVEMEAALFDRSDGAPRVFDRDRQDDGWIGLGTVKYLVARGVGVSDAVVVLLHGWPGLPSDYDEVIARLPSVSCVVPTLAGYGDGFVGVPEAGSATAEAHAARVIAKLPKDVPLVAVGYDIGSRIAQAMLRAHPARFIGAVLTPGYPGIGIRSSAPEMAARLWYQHFHRTPLAARLLDGRPEAIRQYLTYIVSSWATEQGLIHGARFDAVVDAYSRPGAFEASIAWYRDNVGYAAGAPVGVRTTMLWPERDPLFPLEWSDQVSTWFTNVDLQTTPSGHFVPLEQPGAMADAIARRLLA